MSPGDVDVISEIEESRISDECGMEPPSVKIL